jgi:PKD repeat protein
MTDIIYADEESGDILINEDDDVAAGEDTDCECCGDCNCETGGPTAAFSYEQISAEEDGCCFIFADESTTGDCGPIVAWEWNFNDGSAIKTISTPTHCFEGFGPYLVTLKVTDAAGCESTTQTEFSCPCNCEEKAPEANFSYQQTDNDPCCFDFFDESTSHPDCGPIVSWFWNFGPGAGTSTLQNPSKCYFTGRGPWNVTLTVTDDKGCTDTVVSEVECIDSDICDCNFNIPDSVTLVTSGLSGGGASQCDKYSDTWVVPRVPGSASYELAVVKSGVLMRIRVWYTTTGFVYANVSNDPTTKQFGVCSDGVCGASFQWACTAIMADSGGDCTNFGPLPGTLIGLDAADCFLNGSPAAATLSAP